MGTPSTSKPWTTTLIITINRDCESNGPIIGNLIATHRVIAATPPPATDTARRAPITIFPTPPANPTIGFAIRGIEFMYSSHVNAFQVEPPPEEQQPFRIARIPRCSGYERNNG